MIKPRRTQRHLALALLAEQGLLRSSEFVAVGVTAATVARLQADGEVVQVARGLYQAAGADVGPNHALAVAAKLVPRGIICCETALAYHELAERVDIVYIAVGSREWRPKLDDPLFRIVPSPPREFDIGWSVHRVGKIAVRIYDPAKTIVDAFVSGGRQHRFYNSGKGIAAAIAVARTALHQRKVTVPTMMRYAQIMGAVESLQPYLEDLAKVEVSMDIVERVHRRFAAPAGKPPLPGADLAYEAAEEIEKLRAQLKQVSDMALAVAPRIAPTSEHWLSKHPVRRRV